MISLFGKKLFKLFLLFSLIPSVLLAIAGYYLILETSEIISDKTDFPVEDVTEYYNQFIFDQIQTKLTYEDHSLTNLDFCIIQKNDSIDILKIHPSIKTSKIKNLILKSNDVEGGFFNFDSVIIQYAVIKSDSAKIWGGYVHDQRFIDLQNSFQINRSITKSNSQLKVTYITFIAVIFIFLISSTLVLAYFFSKKIASNLSEPINALSVASSRIADGDFDHRVESSSSGEIQSLIDSFNTMASKLESTTIRLSQTERVAAWRNIARRFAHELKNPLQPIIISLYQIEKSLKDKGNYELYKDSLTAASEEIKHLKELADRFSQLAKLPPPKLEKTNLNELIKSLSDLYKEQLSEYQFLLNLPESNVDADIDITYFREVIHNLLKNAIEATSPGNKIEISLRQSTDEIRIDVSDQGCGMSSDTLKTARMPYFTTRKEGTGLGLAMVEKVVNELNGQVKISSQVDKGTTVTIILPQN